jgi:glyoxylate reductase
MTKPTILWDGPSGALDEFLNDEFDVLAWDAEHDEEARSRTVAVVAYGHPSVDAALLDRFPNLKVVSNHGVGVDHIVVADCEVRGLPVGNTPGCLDGSTADMTMALLLSSARNVVVGDRYARSPEFLHYDPSVLIGKEVSGSTLGIIGMGRIGTQVAIRARGFGMTVLYHNRNRRPDVEQEVGVTYVSQEGLLKQSDFVALNCPLTPETTGLMSTAQFEAMKPTAILINAARGPVVDQDALYDALTNNTIWAAATDVTDPEPLPRDHRLLNVPNLIITPHLGSASDRTRRRMIEMSIENMQAGLRGDELPYRVRSN